MNMLENEDNKESVITSQDFPFICRICCRKRSDLRIFEEEGYLLDLFEAITKIDVRSRIEFPKNICNECVDKLQDMTLFIDISKNNYASCENNVKPKKEIIECTDELDCGMSQDSTKTEGNRDNMSHQEPQICRICLSPASSLTLFEERTYQIEMFQNITNIDVTADCSTSEINGICSKCDNELEKISSLAFSSMCNDQKLDNAIWSNMAMKIENDQNSTNIAPSTCQEVKLERFTDGNQEVTNNNTSVNNSFLDEIKVKLEIDVEENVLDSEFATSANRDYQNGSIPDQTCPEEKATDGSCTEKSGESSPFLRSRNFHNLEIATQSDKKPFECDRCNKSFTSMSDLNRHVLTHTKQKPYKCDCCKKKFTQASNLKRHYLTHTGEKPFKCDSCESTFANKQNLQQHMFSHSRRSFKCDCCEKSYVQKRRLKRHKLTHSEEKPFECGCCMKSFRWKGDLKQHMLTHTGEKPFVCDICKKKFTQKSSLRRHILDHSGLKLFKCDFCGKSFNRKSDFQRHMLTQKKCSRN